MSASRWASPTTVLGQQAARALSAITTLATNPVLVRDLRMLFRGWRPFLLQFAYLLVLGIAFVVPLIERILSHAYSHGSYAHYPGDPWSEIGGDMFIAVFGTQCVLLGLVAVVYGAGAISLELEKRTYESLAVTSFSSGEIVAGKAASATLVCWTLMFTSLPLAFTAVMLGGVSPGQVATCYGLLAWKVPLWVCLGLLVSAVAKRSIAAVAGALVALAAEWFISVGISMPTGAAVSFGPLPPALAPFIEPEDFLGVRVPIWLMPTVVNGLAAWLLGVAAAEVLPQFRPRRSVTLRGLVLVLVFSWAFIIVSSLPAFSSGRALPIHLLKELVGLLVPTATAVWAIVVAAIPVYISYEPADDHRSRPLRWLFCAALRPRQWFQRAPEAGVWFCLLFWVVAFAGASTPVALALILNGSAGRAALMAQGPALLWPSLLYTLSIVAWALMGTAIALWAPSRSVSAGLTLLMILVIDAAGIMFAGGYPTIRHVPTHPAVVFACPAVAAASSLPLPYSQAARVLYGLGYLLLVGLIALALLHRLGRRPPLKAGPAEGDAEVCGGE